MSARSRAWSAFAAAAFAGGSTWKDAASVADRLLEAHDERFPVGVLGEVAEIRNLLAPLEEAVDFVAERRLDANGEIAADARAAILEILESLARLEARS